ncbi:MAG: helix-turn-helix transcriptional regulator [Gammaproteobacteria bacterium]
MNDWIDSRTRVWAIAAVIGGIGFYFGMEAIENPDATLLELLLELVEVAPIVLTSVGCALLFRVQQRQRDEQVKVIRDLEIARAQGQRWRAESRSLLNGLGAAIETQFSRWNFTEAEREVALLLLKGLSTKEAAAVRAVSERTVREQARAIYSKAGLTGRASLSAFFLEDLLAPIEGLE